MTQQTAMNGSAPALMDGEKAAHCALRGALVLMAGSGLVVALAFGAMTVLTGPSGWIAKAANAAVNTGSGAVLTAYADEAR